MVLASPPPLLPNLQPAWSGGRLTAAAKRSRSGRALADDGLSSFVGWFDNLPRLCFYFGTIDGSPPGVPGGGITGVLPPPTGAAAIPGSIPAGGQMTPFDCDSWSLSVTLPVDSPGVGKAPR
jgi:hypothetical protein